MHLTKVLFGLLVIGAIIYLIKEVAYNLEMVGKMYDDENNRE